MQLLLHIGSGKTGTTSIQHFFCRNHYELKKLGILYPINKSITPNHILLTPGFVKYDSIRPPHYRFYMDNFRKYKNDFHRFKHHLDKDIKKFKPKILIFSVEQLFRDFGDVSEKNIAEFLKPYFSEIKVIAYIRDPVGDYISRASQRMRTGTIIPSPGVRNIRSVLEYYESQFPKCVYVNAFEKKQLIGGDVVNDFLSKFLPQALFLYKKYNKKISNESLSSDLLFKLNQERLKIQPHAERPTISTIAWLAKIRRTHIMQGINERKNKLILKPKVKKYIEESAKDYLWLKEKYAINFSMIDYSKIKLQQKEMNSCRKFSDIFISNESMTDSTAHRKTPSKINLALVTFTFVFYHQLLRIYVFYFKDLIRLIKKINIFKITSERL